MKIIYDDLIYSLQRSGGASLYWSMLERYIKHDKRLVYPKSSENIFFVSSPECVLLNNRSVVIENFKNVQWIENQPFVFHSCYYRYCKNKNAVNITTVHDFMHELFRNDIKSRLFSYKKLVAVKHSAGIIFNSNSTKNDFYKFFPKYNGFTKVIYNGGYAKEYRPLNIRKNKTIIFVSGRKGYKNFDYAVKILRCMPDYKLCIVGGGHITKQEKKMLDHYIPERYEWHSALSTEELNVKYNEAFFLFYPSLYEGLGLPVIEAQAAGCPVVCCNVSSLPEVAGDAGVYITGKDIESDLHKINLLNDSDYYKSIVEKGIENCKKFSWEKCAEETGKFYKEVYKSYIKK
jgi:mannosyltransferase